MIEVYSNGAYHTLRQGGNAFYLPMDGSSEIGIDQSGKGNDFNQKTLVGLTPLRKQQRKPILNTVNGGTVARSGVFGSDESVLCNNISIKYWRKYVFEGLGTQPTFGKRCNLYL